jgi:hypothetical protein
VAQRILARFSFHSIVTLGSQAGNHGLIFDVAQPG